MNFAQEHLNLSGRWSFQLDYNKTGEIQRWYNNELKEAICLPGSTDEQGFGIKAAEPQVSRLTREYRYVGPAWYQRTIEVPENWKGKYIELFLERAMWQTKIWVDDLYAGSGESLVAPHRFDLSGYLTPGKHRLTIRIDNRLMVNVGHNKDLQGNGWSRMWAMSLTEESQTNWNGIIGRIELRISDPVRIDHVDIYPDIDKKQTEVNVFVRSKAGSVTGDISVSATGHNHSMPVVKKEFRTMDDSERSADDPESPLLSDLTGTYYDSRAFTKVQVILPFGEGALLWDEFSPRLYNLTVKLTASGNNNEKFRDEFNGKFGLRKFCAEGNKLKLNGRVIFLRGNQDNCIHPKTAYPPMDKQSWMGFLQKHKDFGLNCMRFHSWCPPQAAFEAADELGMFVHVEAPVWDAHGNIGYPADRAAFVRNEMDRIIKEYGNHPSFCMMAIGNELGNSQEKYLQYILEVLRYQDNRHLYTASSHPADTNRNDDFHISANGLVGLARELGQMKGSTQWDYERAIMDFRKPFVAHEIGQFTSFPDFYSWFKEEKYTGPLKAYYIGLLKDKFESHHPKERATEFAKASGEVQLLQYKTEIEGMLRTQSLSGFHLNGLMDYPGEGIALIGMLDAMGEDKGIATPEEFRMFCSSTVPLVRLPSQVYFSGDSLILPVEVRHHGPHDLTGSEWRWSIVTQEGKKIGDGILSKHDVPTGKLTKLGNIRTLLSPLKHPVELTLRVWMENTTVMNEWPFWVYPANEIVKKPADVLVTHIWNNETKKALKDGRKVILIPEKENVREPVNIRFGTIFWGRGLFPEYQLRAMGIYCNPSHPALSQFPTREYSGWQWYDLLTGAYAITLDSLPFGYEPVVHIIDDFLESHRLGVLMEARVGKGNLLISTLNLGKEGDRSAVQKQMLKSLTDYTGSANFRPMQQLSTWQIDGLFQDNYEEK